MSSVRAIQVEPLPQSSGGSQSLKQMDKTNTTLSMLVAQSSADSAFDPSSPAPVTAPKIKEAFCLGGGGGPDPAHGVLVVAFLFILYGIISK